MPLQKIIKNAKNTYRDKKLESDLIKSFTRYRKHILEELEKLNESPQLLNAIKLSEVIFSTCEKIGANTDFQRIIPLIKAVRKFDREVDSLITAFKYKFESDNPEKFRVKIKKDFSNQNYILGNLISIMQDYKEELEYQKEAEGLVDLPLANTPTFPMMDKTKLQAIKNKFFDSSIFLYAGKDESMQSERNFIKKSKNWIYYKRHPEHIQDNISKLQKFKKKNSSFVNKVAEIEMPLKIEQIIIDEVLRNFSILINDFEQIGYYNHLQNLQRKWLNYLEKLALSIKPPEFNIKYQADLRSQLRKNYLEWEMWIERVNIKYSKEENRHPKEHEVNPKFLKEVTDFYPEIREAYRNRFHDGLILEEIIKIEKEEARILKEKTDEENRIAKEKEKVRLRKEKTERQKILAKEKEEARILKAKADEVKRIAKEKENARLRKEKTERQKVLAKEKEEARILKEKADEVKRIAKEKENERLRKEKAERQKILAKEKEEARILKEKEKAEKQKLLAKKKEEAKILKEKQKEENLRAKQEEMKNLEEKEEKERIRARLQKDNSSEKNKKISKTPTKPKKEKSFEEKEKEIKKNLVRSRLQKDKSAVKEKRKKFTKTPTKPQKEKTLEEIKKEKVRSRLQKVKPTDNEK